MLDAADRWMRLSEAFREDVLAGLSSPRIFLPCRWLYDVRGSELFEEITKLEEYYPTRTEFWILNRYADEIAAFCGRNLVLLEYGAGAARKTEILMGVLRSLQLYVPIRGTATPAQTGSSWTPLRSD
jgi:L-histidine Nalpha-methyltransferase